MRILGCLVGRVAWRSWPSCRIVEATLPNGRPLSRTRAATRIEDPEQRGRSRAAEGFGAEPRNSAPARPPSISACSNPGSNYSQPARPPDANSAGWQKWVEAWLESPTLVLLSEFEGYWGELRTTIEAGRVVGPLVHDARALVCGSRLRPLSEADDYQPLGSLRRAVGAAANRTMRA